MFFLVIVGEDVDQSYVISGDGSTFVPAKINAPIQDDTNWRDYTIESVFAIVKDEVYVFGGAYERGTEKRVIFS